jgi:transposase, IS5 family
MGAFCDSLELLREDSSVMADREHSQPSFAEEITTASTRRGGFLDEIDTAFDWDGFEVLLAPVYDSTKGALGYLPVTLLKIILLQQWYTLSDHAAEEAVRDRLSFRRFCGLPLDRETPDHAMIWRFRQAIDKLGLSEALLAEADRQLDAHGLVIKPGTLAEATLIPGAVERPYVGDGVNEPDQRCAVQPDKTCFEAHQEVDERRRQAQMTSANVYEMRRAATLIPEEGYFADKAGKPFRGALPSAAHVASINIESAAMRLTDTALGYNEQDLADTLKAIASEIGVCHIAYLRFSPDKSADSSLLTAVVTYSRAWQVRYFVKQYIKSDPIISYAQYAVLPYDWATLAIDDPKTKAFFIDAANHNVGRNGLSIPVRNRRGVFSLVSFTSDLSTDEWELFKLNNMPKLQLLSVLIDSAANINFKLPSVPVTLSNREEQCLLWAARGKTYQEIAEILNLAFGSVKTHLDTARHKLRCMNLVHAVAVAIATGVIPASALK